MEDESELVDILRQRIEVWGYPSEYIHAFSTPADVLHFASNNPIGVAFVDIKLDGGVMQDPVYTSDMEVLKAIKRQSPGCKAVLVSGFGTYEMAKRGILELGASYYLAKPFRLDDVVQIVDWAARKESARPFVASGSRQGRAESEQILIVDDDPMVSEGVSMGLTAFGYNTTLVNNGEEALSVMDRRRFDAVLLGLMMPGVNGIEVMRRMQKDRKVIDTFILSAVSDNLTARRVTELGAKGYFLKPCDIGLIIRTLEFHFAKRQR